MGHWRCPLPWLASCSIHRACWGVRAQVAVVDATVITAGEDDEFMGEVGHLWLKIKEKIAALKLRTWAKKTLQQQLEHLELHGFERSLEQRALAEAINSLLGFGEWGPVPVVLCALDGPSVSCLTSSSSSSFPRGSRGNWRGAVVSVGGRLPPSLSHLRPGPSVMEVGGGGPHSWVVGRGRGDLSPGWELPVGSLGPCEHVPLPVTRPSWLVEWAEGPR
jgi:hypothetical protein